MTIALASVGSFVHCRVRHAITAREFGTAKGSSGGEGAIKRVLWLSILCRYLIFGHSDRFICCLQGMTPQELQKSECETRTGSPKYFRTCETLYSRKNRAQLLISLGFSSYFLAELGFSC